MSDFFIGQVLPTAFNFAPRFFAQCNGQLLPIAQNQALFSLIGTQYGGNGINNFALPDLRSRTPVGFASSVDPGWQPSAVQIGEAAGSESVTLLGSNLPAHAHTMNASTASGDNRVPVGRIHATNVDTASPASLYGPATGSLVAQSALSVAPAGSGQPHSNLQPFATISFCIALSGIFPSRN